MAAFVIQLKLEEAKTEIQQHLRTNRKVCIVSVDLAGDYGAVQKAVQEVGMEAREKMYKLVYAAR